MTLEGWTIIKHMCAGLIPGVNIMTRPRVITLFIDEAINEASIKVKSAVMSSPYVNAKKMYGELFDMVIPPLSQEKRLEQEAKSMFALFDSMVKRKRGK